MDDDYLYTEISEQHYSRVTSVNGVRTTVCDNRFEIIAKPDCEIAEQQAIQMLRTWVRERQAKLRKPGDLPG